MNKRVIPILAIIMTFSLLVFVSLQIYFLKEIINDSEKNFNATVKLAMENVSDKIQNQEITEYYKLFGNFYNEAQQKDNITTRQDIQSIVDSGDFRYISFKYYAIEKKSIPIPLSKGDTLESTKLFSDEGTIKVQKEDSIKPNVEALTQELQSSFEDGSFSINQFARLNVDEKPINQRVNIKDIKKLINKEFKLKDITLNYKIGILETNLDTTSVQEKGFFNDKVSSKNYNSVLFYDKIDQPLYYLSVYFPNKNLSVYQPNFGAIAVTLSTILVILAIFIASLYFILKQKKISEIKTDFINNMSHEFKTPIATISLATDSLKNSKINTDPQKIIQYANLIKQENTRMHKQVEMVLRMSNIENNQLAFKPEKTSILDTIKSAIQSISLTVESRNGIIIEELDPKNVFLDIDPFHMNNALVNILDNANKYSLEIPKITVKSKLTETSYIIEVSDEGIGINKTNIKKIFDKFYREETGNIHNVKGHGLGLTYVKDIIDKHNGSITVKSTLKKGTTFMIELPLK